MADAWNLPWTASCMCGQIKMRITDPPLLIMACHCRGCQSLTSSAYSLTAILPASGFEVVEGSTVRGGMHGEHEQLFCDHCKNWVYTRGAGYEEFVNFRPTLLEDNAWVRPFIDVAAATKLPGVKTGAAISFDGFPSMDDFPDVAAQFAETGARPNSGR